MVCRGKESRILILVLCKHTLQEGGGRSKAEDPPVNIKYGQSTLFQAGKGEK